MKHPRSRKGPAPRPAPKGPPPPRRAAPARQAALQAFLRASDPKAPGLADLCDQAAQRMKLEPLDAALAREMALGAARRSLWLEHLLDGFCERPMDASHREARAALLLALHQAAFLDRVPDHAIANDAVTQVAQAPGGARLRGFANAVVRRALRDREGLRPGEGAPWRAALGAPDWAVDAIAGLLPDDEVRVFFAASLEEAPLVLRLRGADAAAMAGEVGEGASIEPSPLAADCVRLAGRGIAPQRLAAFRDGLATAQDDGAVAATRRVLDGECPRRILDFCASPGGKAALLADDHRDAEVVALDVSDAKIRRLHSTLARLGLDARVRYGLVDESDALGAFDAVLVDAPCSGLGTLRRHPEIRLRRDAAAIERLAALQLAILRRAAPRVAPGGLLAYTLCTVTRAESDGVVEAFLAEEPAFVLEGGVQRLWPHRDGCDGYAFARLRRTRA